MIRRCYESLTSVDKERLLDAMNSSPSFTGPTSQSSREIRSLISTVHLDVYRSGISEWRALISKQKKAELMLAELEKTADNTSSSTEKGKSHSKKRPNPSHDEIDDIFPPEVEKPKKKEKRPQDSSTSDKRPQQHAPPLASSKSDPDDLQNDEKKRKRKRKRPSTTSEVISSDQSPAIAQSTSTTQSHTHAKTTTHHNSANFGNKKQTADMNRIKTLQSGKMINIKRITEELEHDINRKKKRDG